MRRSPSAISDALATKHSAMSFTPFGLYLAPVSMAFDHHAIEQPAIPLPCGGLCVLGRLALVCRQALFLRREWPRIEPRTVFSTMVDHLRADSSLHRRCNGECAPQIVAAAGKNDLHAVAHKRVKPHSAQPIMLLKNRERSLDCCSDAADHSIATLLSWRQFGMMFVGPAHQAVLDSGLSKTRMPRMGVIGLIAIDRFLVSADEIIGQFRIRDGGIREISPADHRVVSVDANVNLVAEDGFVALAAPSCIRIRAGLCRGLSRFSARLARRLRPSGHQRGINQRAMLEDHVFGFELTIDLGKYPIHQTVSRKLLPETPQRAVIGSAIMQAQPCKAAKRDAIGNRHLQRRVGQAMPDAEQQAPQQYFCRIAGITRASLAALTKQRSHRVSNSGLLQAHPACCREVATPDRPPSSAVPPVAQPSAILPNQFFKMNHARSHAAIER